MSWWSTASIASATWTAMAKWSAFFPIPPPTPDRRAWVIWIWRRPRQRYAAEFARPSEQLPEPGQQFGERFEHPLEPVGERAEKLTEQDEQVGAPAGRGVPFHRSVARLRLGFDHGE